MSGLALLGDVAGDVSAAATIPMEIASPGPSPSVAAVRQALVPRRTFERICSDKVGDSLGWFDSSELKIREMVYNAVFAPEETPYEHQEEALLAWLRGHHVLLVTPTNSGKSMVFLLIAMWSFTVDPHAIVPIVYPTTALNMVQVGEMNRRCPELRATWYDATGDTLAQRRAIERGEHCVIGVTPELAAEQWYKNMTRTDAYRCHLKAIIVDEVHCVATWDFRPTYAWLRELEGRKIMCTATLTKRAEGKVLGILGLTLAQVFPIRRSVIKDNLYIEVVPRPGASSTDTHLYNLAEDLRKHARGEKEMPRVIFFCKSTTMLRGYYAQVMEHLGIDAYGPSSSDFYQDCYVLRIFAQSPIEVRQFFCNEWVKNPDSKARLLFTTSLTEMGFDMDGLYDGVASGVPATMMHFRQLAGRLARGKGEAGRLVVEWNGTDKAKIDDELKEWLANTTQCRHVLMYKYFGEKFVSTGACCDICCDASGIARPKTAFTRYVAPPAPVGADTPDALSVTVVYEALLASAINPPLNPKLLSPLLSAKEHESRLQAGGPGCVLCKEYAEAFRHGVDMSSYMFDHPDHKDIVLKCIANATAAGEAARDAGAAAGARAGEPDVAMVASDIEVLMAIS